MQKINELQLAKELMKFPSITPRDAGVMRFLEKKLKKIGFKTKILDFKEKNFQPVKNLYARLGSKGRNFCFAGHLDVVPPGNIKDWTVNPFRPSIKKGHLIGRGANDMKGSVAAFVSAVSIFLNNNKSFNGSISLLITGDEEGDAVNGTKKVVDYLKKRNEKINFCLVGEPTNPNKLGEMIKIAGADELGNMVYGRDKMGLTFGASMGYGILKNADDFGGDWGDDSDNSSGGGFDDDSDFGSDLVGLLWVATGCRYLDFGFLGRGVGTGYFR